MTDPRLDEGFREKLDWADRFVRDRVEPLDLVFDQDMSTPYDRTNRAARRIVEALQAEVRSNGLWACHLPPELGGKGYGAVKLTFLNAIVGRSHFGPVVFGCQGPDSGNSEILAVYGTPEQKKRYLEPLLDNRMFSCFSMTEPAGGSDPTAFVCRAVRDGDDWVISGEKWFSSHANHADFLIVMTVTDPEAPPHSRATMFIVPTDTPGVEIVRQVGFLHEPFGTGAHPYLRYNQVRVPDSARLGPVGKGFEVAQARLGGGRLHHAQRTIGLCERLLDAMAERALSRRSFGKTIAEHQAVQHQIAQSHVDLEMFRCLVLSTAELFDQGKAHGREGNLAVSTIKVAMAQVGERILMRAMHLHGSLGLSNELPFARWLAVILQLGLADGPTEVHLTGIAKGLLRRHKPVDGNFPSEHLVSRKAWALRELAPHLEGDPAFAEALAKARQTP